MFKWLRRKGPILTEREQRALRLGEELGADLANAVEIVIEKRYQPAFDGYISVLRSNLQKSFADKEAPPVWLTRVHYSHFEEHVGKLKQQMIEDIPEALTGLFKIVDEMGLRKQIEEGLAMRVGTFIDNLTATGMKLVADYGEGLLDADKAWRKANPERAKQFPIDDLA